MSSNSFKVKNALTLTPLDPADVPSPQAGDVISDITDSNKIKRWDAVAASWVPMGGAQLKGQSDVSASDVASMEVPHHQATLIGSESFLLETGNRNRLINPGFEASVVDQGWTIANTGTAVGTVTAEVSNVLEGRVSANFTCVGGASGGTCTLYQDVNSVHVDGISQIYVYSEESSGVKVIKRVNAATALELDVTGKSEWQLMKIPGAMGTTSTGVGVEVTVSASQTIIVTMDEAKVGLEDVKTDATKIESQSSHLSSSTVFNNTVFKGALTDSEGSGLYSYDSVTGIYTALKKSVVTLSVSAITSTTTALGVGARFIVSGVNKDQFDHTNASTGQWASTTHSRLVNPGDTFYGHNASAVDTSGVRVSVTATTADNTEVFATSADFFSTDTNTLAFKATAITDSDPVGTFNTYSYAINTNTKTICGAAPTQTIADMKTNGMQVYARAYNAASTCGNPARVEVKIAKAGTSLPTLSKEIYKSAGNITRGELDYISFASDVVEIGPRYKSYNKETGVLIFDSGFRGTSSTAAYFIFPDGTSAASGYLVINAQPKKTTAVQDFGEFDYVSARYTISTAETIGTTTGTLAYKVKYEDTHSAYNTTTGEFTVPLGAGGKYRISGKFNTGTVTLGITNNLLAGISINGTDQSLKLTKGNGGNTTFPAHIYDEFTLEEGDVVKIVASSSVATTTTTDSRYNSLTITRIPGQFR